MDRLARLLAHLSPEGTAEGAGGAGRCAASVSAEGGRLDAATRAAIREYLDRHDLPLRDEACAMLSEPLFAPTYDLSKEAHQDLTWRRLHRVKEFMHAHNMVAGEEDPLQFFALSESLYFTDLSLIVTMGAQWGLFGGSVRALGTEQHRREVLPRIQDLTMPGSFALTELAHGSNVRGIETTITFDPDTRELLVHTPNEGAQKFLIGNGTVAQCATVWGQLVVAGENHGVHAVLVPLRGANGRPLPGVRVASCGQKMGLNGVRNGRFWFSHVRVPVTNLLSKFSGIDESGAFFSAIPDKTMRFAASMSNLTVGRTNMIFGANNMAKLALCAAVRYGARRLQFSEDKATGREVPILGYNIHQHRLLPHLATVFVLGGAANALKELAAQQDPSNAMQIHLISSGLKAFSGWHMRDTLIDCRECCGGIGFKADSRLGQIKADGDAWMTFEGDNFVLLQQVSRSLVREFDPQAPRRSMPGAGAGAVIDDAFVLQGLGHRLDEALARLHARVAERRAAGENGQQAWNSCGWDAVEVGRAHTHLYLYENAKSDAEAHHAPLADEFRLLWGLHVLGAAPDKVEELLARLAPLAVDVVNSFGVPDSQLPPIAGDYIEVHSYASALNASGEAGAALL